MEKSQKSIKTIQMKLHNIGQTKSNILNHTMKNYTLCYNEMLKDAKANIEYIKEHCKNDKNDKYTAQTVSKFFSGKTIHKKYNMEQFYDDLKNNVSGQICSYLELLKTDDKANFPSTLKSNNKNILAKIKKLNNKLLYDLKITKEQQRDIEQKIKGLQSKYTKSKKYKYIQYCRYEEDRGSCLLYCPKTNKYYVKLTLFNREESKKFFIKRENNSYNELYYIPSMNKLEINNKPKNFIIVPLEFGLYQEKYLKLARKNKITLCSMQLLKKGNDFYISVPLELENTNNNIKIESETKMGIDLGITRLATLSVLDKDNNLLFTKSYNGTEYNKAFENYALKLTRSQINYAEYPKDKKYLESFLHKICNDIVDITKKYNCKISMEDLNIDKSKERIISNPKFKNLSNKKIKGLTANINRWAYGRMKDILTYKLNINGLNKPIFINPKFTSEECNQCGHIEIIESKGQNRNRETQSHFKCKKCGFTINADDNASIVIAKRADNIVKIKPKLVDDKYIYKNKLFKFEAIEDSPEKVFDKYISLLLEYKKEYDLIPFSEKKHGTKFAKQYKVMKALESNTIKLDM